jgi:hypothetical protein
MAALPRTLNGAGLPAAHRERTDTAKALRRSAFFGSRPPAGYLPRAAAEGSSRRLNVRGLHLCAPFTHSPQSFPP